MSFGKNPHVAKAQAAEQKAQLARDESARTLAWREAARLWDRAAERENMEARKQDYAARAEAARAAADGDVPAPTDAADEDTVEVTLTADASEAEGPASEAGKTPSRWLN
jgi:hypothetical protein